MTLTMKKENDLNERVENNQIDQAPKELLNSIRLNNRTSTCASATIVEEQIETSTELEFDIDALDAQFRLASMEFQSNMSELRKNPENQELREKIISTNATLQRMKSWSSMLNTQDGLELLRSTRDKRIVKEKQILQRKYEINEILNLAKVNSAIDVCFLMDCTGSMREYIDAAKSQVRMLTQTISHLYSTKIRLGFVGYRDINEANEQIDFTDDENQFEQFLNRIQAIGGDDTCEDVFGGLEVATKLSWLSPNRVLLHICDAPCHGKKFHEFENSSDDNYPDGDPKNRDLIDLMFNIKRLEIIYCKIELNQTTRKMFEQFSFVFGPIEEIHVEKPNDLIKSVIQKTSSIIQTNIQSSLASYHNSNRSSKVCTILSKEPDWNSIEEDPIDIYQIVSLKYVHELFQPLKIFRSVGLMKIAAHPFAKGSLRYAYFGQYCHEDLNLIDVVYKELSSVDPNEDPFTVYREYLESQSIAQFLAEKFNEAQKLQSNKVLPILYADANLVQQKVNPSKIYQVERRMNNVWHKWNNNSGGVSINEYSNVLQAFSHWTYHFTSGRLMVVDLQGIQTDNAYLLTDPALHSEDLLRFRTTRTNLGVKGMEQFFRTHICNRLCEHLTRPSLQNSIENELFLDFQIEQVHSKSTDLDEFSMNQNIEDDFVRIDENQLDTIEMIDV